MKYLSDFVSNTSAASGNQYIFTANGQQIEKGRVFFKITHPGSDFYRFSFSNALDSTFADGSVSKCNLQCPDWKILRCSVALCAADQIGTDFMEPDAAQLLNNSLSAFQTLTFSGAKETRISGVDMIFSDPVFLNTKPGDYLCVETEFQGSTLPYHEESLLPVYRHADRGWVYDKRVPLPGIIACSRPVKARIGFWGDSITQGIGTIPNSYRHWCALVADRLPREYACWNLGLGYGRASDAASNGIWMKKALQNDILCVCFGVNDILQGATADELKRSLLSIVQNLKSFGKTVLVQTVPPFDYAGSHLLVWHEVNRYIREELSSLADGIFDNVPLLGKSAREPHKAKFGGHPNEDGCALWADSLLNKLREILKQGDCL